MTLAEWIVAVDKSAADAAADIGVDVSTMRRYLRGERIPERDIMRRIFVVSNGQVTANDFYGLGRDDPRDVATIVFQCAQQV